MIISTPGGRLSSISVTQVDTLYMKGAAASPIRSLEFTENKRNFITDKLFAGNIYLGPPKLPEDHDELEEEEKGKGSDSWRERFS